ncbi:lecithin retinol acyltransferase family protein [Cupriavidus basilensis]|uniref:Lecithin retinol acyltransferase family protein n=1 Tax=Cupriavidus basilensis TaxID=68895 RepID=A0ABT6AIM0_9BURK|nr:lecithin retinol acyltransferase family protein [Cupriavidus basilensis]MDF3832444.1 lecithin retinol acyltransferase family protein [Cupriavidus basilensis]
MNHQEQQGHAQANPRQGADAIGTGLPLGAHLITERRGYAHHGIYIGAGKVVHYAGFAGSLHRGPVEEITLDAFAVGQPVSVKANPCARYAGLEAVARACSRLGEDNYRLLTNNCEHFCTWCLFGESRSEQVEACLHHPSRAVHTLANLLRTFFESEWKGGHFGASTA